VSLLAASAALLAAFVVIELRSPAPLLPLRIFRNRSLSAANAVVALVGAVTFSEFFLLTLYMQQVLGYSAIETGVGFASFAFSVVVFSNLAQRLVTRFGVRIVLATGQVLVAASLVPMARLPVHGHYFWDLFPAYVVGGIGLAFSFVPAFVAGLTGVARADAGVASGLINTSRQVGGAVGLAAATTIASAYTTGGAGVAAQQAGLTNGFQVAFMFLAGMAVLGAVIAAGLLGPHPQGEVERFNRDNREPIEEAA
jgi:predicted MFS family arabinose efflux permease